MVRSSVRMKASTGMPGTSLSPLRRDLVRVMLMRTRKYGWHRTLIFGTLLAMHLHRALTCTLMRMAA